MVPDTNIFASQMLPAVFESFFWKQMTWFCRNGLQCFSYCEPEMKTFPPLKCAKNDLKHEKQDH